ncbi:hypothetical protein AVEN_142533-1 [Araneus ventricosus]|uniref:Uncharacterized protein n=1 Tax=Araneus ventricosus TaxID=182803 RepID=A0A4Y2CG04_ARAVE|nr:hypothetical protein AVEN_142533-1 [Araneus ventricosus]
MSVQSFDELAAKITRKIQNQNTRMRLSIPPLEMLAVTINVYCPVGCHVLKDVQFPLRFEGKVRSNRIGQVICDSFALQEVCGYCPTVLHTPEVVYGFCVILTFITSNDQIGECVPGLITLAGITGSGAGCRVPREGRNRGSSDQRMYFVQTSPCPKNVCRKKGYQAGGDLWRSFP